MLVVFKILLNKIISHSTPFYLLKYFNKASIALQLFQSLFSLWLPRRRFGERGFYKEIRLVIRLEEGDDGRLAEGYSASSEAHMPSFSPRSGFYFCFPSSVRSITALIVLPIQFRIVCFEEKETNQTVVTSFLFSPCVGPYPPSSITRVSYACLDFR